VNDVTGAPKPVPTGEPPSRPDHWQSGKAVLRSAGRDCIDHLLSNAVVGCSGDPEGIHQMRVAVRRLRATLSAFAPFLPPDSRRRASHELRWLADTLGEARNLDVLGVEILAPACASLPPASGFERLAKAIDVEREYAHAEAEAAINSGHYADSVRKLLHWFDDSSWQGYEPLGHPIGESAPIVLARLYRAVKKQSRRFSEQSEEKRHQLRIALKKMRYAAELLSGLYDNAASKRFIQRIKRLQDDLGYRNDVRVARDTIDNLTRANAPDLDMVKADHRILAWHKERLASNEAELKRHLRQLLATEPFWSHRRNLRMSEAALSRRQVRRGGRGA
jgi:CHAD domain-containing protein